MPPLSSSNCGPPQKLDQPVKATTRLRHTLLERGTPRPVTPEDGYRPRLTPGNLVKSFAKGQSFTDLNNAQEYPPLGLQLAFRTWSTQNSVGQITSAVIGAPQSTRPSERSQASVENPDPILAGAMATPARVYMYLLHLKAGGKCRTCRDEGVTTS